MKLDGSVTISRVHSNKAEQDFIEIRFFDESSRIEFATAELSLADFALCLTGMGFVTCKLEVNALNKVGMVREHKTEIVFVPDGTWKDRESIARKAIAKFEVDGWIGRVEDGCNHHNWVKKDVPKGKKGMWYKVHFTRHVSNKGNASEI